MRENRPFARLFPVLKPTSLWGVGLAFLRPAGNADKGQRFIAVDTLSMESPGRIAGIDYGTVRIGIAITDPRRTLASPLENYQRRDLRQDAERFRRLVAEESIRLFVVGLPVHLDGQESAKSFEARQFGQWLTEVTGVGVEFFDERFSTAEAHAILSDGQLRGRRRKQRLDMLAAQVMLAAYLETTPQNRGNIQGLDDVPGRPRS